MKKLVVASIGFAALVGAPAMAADMPVKTPAPKEPAFTVYNWTGFYVGIQGGSGWSHAVQTDARPFTSDHSQPNGGVIGGTLGYNAQFGHVELGLEGDGSGLRHTGY